MKKLKQAIGIDVSKDTLAVCFGFLSQTQITKYVKHCQFSNNLKGFEELLNWTKELQDPEIDLCFIMEATGVYYENLAYFLNSHDKIVHVLLPNKSKHFAKSLDIKSKTDKIDAKILTQLGLERQLTKWEPHSQIMHMIKQLCREHKDLKEKLTVLKNQLHAKEHAYECLKTLLKRLKSQIKLLESQVVQIEAEIREICYQDEKLTEKVSKIETIPGLGFMTIITIVAETNGFLLIENSKQLVSYCGYDVSHNESGEFKGRAKISKKGNRFVRRALFMPSLSAIRFNPYLKAFYEGLVERKKNKMLGLTAVARKMLILTYTLWKNNTEFDTNYKKVA